MTTNPQTEARDRAAANEASTATDRATAAGQNMTFAVSVPAPAPTDWIDGHPQLEAIAAAVWERCGRSDSGTCVEDDPRNIAVAALAAVLPAPADRAAILRAEADRIDATREPFPIAVQNGITWATAELRRAAAASGSGRVADETRAPETQSDLVGKAVAALQAKAQELSAEAEEEMRRDLEEEAQVWHEAAALVRRVTGEQP